jgi:F-type H+-transporting ATPase subunit b
MGIDWFTIIAQIINFLILVALLQRFLYGPIVRAMDRREVEISSRLNVATEKTAEAEQERVRYEGLASELAGNRDALLAKTRDEVAAFRQSLLENARQEVDKNLSQWQESFQRERESFLLALRRHVSQEVCAVAHQAVTEMADASLEERMAICLERRIRELDESARTNLAAHFLLAGQEIVVRSAFEMNSEARKTIFGTLHDLTVVAAEMEGYSGSGNHDPRLPVEANAAGSGGVRFEVDPALVCGIEIVSGGRSLAWNLEEYLDEMEQRLLEAIGKGSGGGEKEISRQKAGEYGS